MYFYKEFKWDARGGKAYYYYFFLTKKIVSKLKNGTKTSLSLGLSLKGILPPPPFSLAEGRFLESQKLIFDNMIIDFPHS